MPAKKIYCLRTCNADLTSYNGFKWKAKGKVVCADWNPAAKCGKGLHGLAKGEGNGDLLNWATDAKWLVFWAYEDQLVDIKGKVKVKAANVVYCGDQIGATNYILAKHPEAICVGANVTKGHNSTVNVGYGGTATAGDGGKATAGDGGKATAGISGTATAGISGTATAGQYGTATADKYGKATAGYGGKATAGMSGTATAGYRGTATAGDYGTATAGEYGRIQVSWYDSKAERYRTTVGYAGEDGIEANVAYKCDNEGKLVKA
jgi:hypothetical protein